MEKKKVIKELSKVLSELGLESELQMQSKQIAEYLYKQLEIISWVHKEKADAVALSLLVETSPAKDIIKAETDNSVNDFVDRMYEIYPSKCPKRNASTGKSRKDKDRIKRLLKVYTEEQIEQVIRAEVDEKYEKQYMQNFSTFLNSIPFRSDDLFESGKVAVKKYENEIIINGVTYK